MICWGVPRTLPSGPELSKTRFTTLPPEGRLRLFLARERDLEDLILLYVSLINSLSINPYLTLLSGFVPLRAIDFLGLASGVR